MHVSGDEEPDDRPPFQWNRQAIFMLCFTMLALAVPLMGVIWCAHGYLVAKQTPAVEATENPALRSALEKASEGALAVPPIADDRPSLLVSAPASERAPRISALREAVAKAGGSIVEMDPGVRFLVNAPEGSAASIRQAVGAESTTAPAIDKAPIYEVRFQ